MSVSFCAVPLTVPPPDVAAEIEAVLSWEWLLEFAQKVYPGTDLQTLGFRGFLPTQPIKLGTLYWPAGAARFAYAHYLASEAQRNSIEAYLAANGYTGVLTISDGTHSVSPTMSMLPVRPLSRVSGSPGAYLLTLVDARFWWWFLGGNVTMTPGTTTWAQLYASIATLLGINLAADTVASAYLKPAGDFATSWSALPVLLDAVAFSCGQRLVRRFDGTVCALNAGSGETAFASNLALSARLMGDSFDMYPASANALPAVTAGLDLNLAVPASVTVTFPAHDSTTLVPESTFYTVATTLASLALSEYGNSTGVAGTTKILHCSMPAALSGGVPTNASEINALASQASTDYYRWNSMGVDADYSGVCAWVMDGVAQLVEVRHTFDSVNTRVQRGPWLDYIDKVLVYGSLGSQSNPPVINQTFNFLGDTFNFDGSDTININGTTGPTVNINAPWTWTGVGPFILNVPLDLCGYLFWCQYTITVVATTTNNLVLPDGAPGHIVYRIQYNSSAEYFLTGIVQATPPASDAGQVIALMNVDTFPLVIEHNSAASTAANRFLCPDDVDYVVDPDAMVLLIYDRTSSRWRIGVGQPCLAVTDSTTTVNNTIIAEFVGTGGITATVTNPATQEARITIDGSGSGGTTGTNGQSVGPGLAYNLTNAYANIGVTVSIPGAGKYLITASASSVVVTSAATTTVVLAELYDVTNAVVVGLADVPILGVTGTAAGTFTGGSALTAIYTAPGALTIQLRAKITVTLNVTSSQIPSNGAIIDYVKLAT